MMASFSEAVGLIDRLLNETQVSRRASLARRVEPETAVVPVLPMM